MGISLVGLNRLSSERSLFATGAFGFVRLGEGICTGSSMMPRKRNSDLLELFVARHHQVLGQELARGTPGVAPLTPKET